MLQNKHCDKFDTAPDTCSSCGRWFSLWMLSSKFPSFSEKQKEAENEKKTIDGLQKKRKWM